jgi:hypothetical protein
MTLEEAVKILNSLGTELRYTWPPLLDLPSDADHFFGPAVKQTIARLKESCILENEAGQTCCPKDLLYVPDNYRLGDDHRPPIPSRGAIARYLSRKYDPGTCIEPLKAFGLKTMGYNELLYDLRELVDSRFQSMDSEWHAEFADMILNAPQSVRSSLKSWNFCPDKYNRSGWVTPSSAKGKIFYSTEKLIDDDSNPLPRGIALHYIPLADHQDERRRRLFVNEFGAKDLSNSVGSIAAMIGKAHELKNICTLNRMDLVTHVIFLFKHRGKYVPPDKLWVVTQSGDRQLVSKIFAEPLEYAGQLLPVPVLHEDYPNTFPEPETRRVFLDWIREALKMQKIPRLVTTDDGQTYSLSSEMNFIAQKCDTYEFLALLKRNWHYYRSWLAKGNTRFQEKVLDQVMKMEVRCQDFQKHALNVTILPSEDTDLVDGIVSLPLLPIPRNEGRRLNSWLFLGELGVKLRPDVNDWVECLRNLSGLKGHGLPKMRSMGSLAESIYRRMEKAADARPEKIPGLRLVPLRYAICHTD